MLNQKISLKTQNSRLRVAAVKNAGSEHPGPNSLMKLSYGIKLTRVDQAELLSVQLCFVDQLIACLMSQLLYNITTRKRTHSVMKQLLHRSCLCSIITVA